MFAKYRALIWDQTHIPFLGTAASVCMAAAVIVSLSLMQDAHMTAQLFIGPLGSIAAALGVTGTLTSCLRANGPQKSVGVALSARLYRLPIETLNLVATVFTARLALVFTATIVLGGLSQALLAKQTLISIVGIVIATYAALQTACWTIRSLPVPAIILGFLGGLTASVSVPFILFSDLSDLMGSSFMPSTGNVWIGLLLGSLVSMGCLGCCILGVWLDRRDWQPGSATLVELSIWTVEPRSNRKGVFRSPLSAHMWRIMRGYLGVRYILEATAMLAVSAYFFLGISPYGEKDVPLTSMAMSYPVTCFLYLYLGMPVWQGLERALSDPSFLRAPSHSWELAWACTRSLAAAIIIPLLALFVISTSLLLTRDAANFRIDLLELLNISDATTLQVVIVIFGLSLPATALTFRFALFRRTDNFLSLGILIALLLVLASAFMSNLSQGSIIALACIPVLYFLIGSVLTYARAVRLKLLPPETVRNAMITAIVGGLAIWVLLSIVRFELWLFPVCLAFTATLVRPYATLTLRIHALRHQ